MNLEVPELNYYVELDCLLDTRLGTLAKINPGADVAVIESGKYYQRYEDNFSALVNIPKEVFDHHYGHRDKETLKLSRTTLVYKLINDAMSDNYLKFMQNIIDHPPTLHVNIYPYELTADESAELKALLSNIMISYSVKIIRENPETLPPWKLLRRFGNAWMYNFDDYIRPFYRELEKRPSGGIVLHFPAICRGETTYGLDEEEIVHGFTRVQDGLAGYLTLDFGLAFDYSFHLHTTAPKSGVEFEPAVNEENLEEVAAKEHHELDQMTL